MKVVHELIEYTEPAILCYLFALFTVVVVPCHRYQLNYKFIVEYVLKLLVYINH